MSHEAISSWVAKARERELVSVKPDGTLVIQRVEPKDKGWAIMKIAETLFPWFTEMFKDKRDNSGMLMHPARVRALALNVAQDIIKKQDQ